ncbi:class I SAM-dependent methyltransferase [Leptospira sp. 201903070]|uniref:Class I SAM-dependent methyltransferase n=1 Tax=Leptospira ainlahdjerensis TaxID=2810033 RepID=A0ABS2UDJ4_9LEPT|nr:class I SAM-dependent methyltransferase [Leptospira ainlahdjerensis]
MNQKIKRNKLGSMNPEFWNQRYASEEWVYGLRENDFLREEISRFKKGSSVLDLASGEGRNSLFLARQGFQVTAVDQSAVGMDKLKKQSRLEGLSVTCIESDVLAFQTNQKFDAVVITFLHLSPSQRKKLFRMLPSFLSSEGILIAEWFHPDQRVRNYPSGGPEDPNFMVTLEELQKEFASGWRIFRLEHVERDLDEGEKHSGRGSVVRISAQKVNSHS